MKILIVDDETPARVEMRRLLSVHPECDIAGESADVAGALALTGELRPDLVFLDIRLAGESGFDYVARLGDGAPRILFVTAYDRYAIRAFECNALDYLLKPVRPERLAEALRRARLAGPPERRDADEADAVFIKAGAFAGLVPWRDVMAIVAEGNYTRVRLADGRELIVLKTLREWLALAPEGLFLQVHRSVLVRRSGIRELRQAGEKRHELVLGAGAPVPVGRVYATAVREALEG